MFQDDLVGGTFIFEGAAVVAKYAKKADISIEEAENRWIQAKNITTQQKPKIKEGSEEYYAYVMGVFKKSMGIMEDAIFESPESAGDWAGSITKAASFTDISDVFKDVFDIDPLELPIPKPPVDANDYKKDDTPYGLKVRGVKTREKLNLQAKEILERAKTPDDLTPEDREILKQYSGRGGLTENSQFEYYTPEHVAAGVWDLMAENGFVNGNVLDPCTGHGMFSGTKPEKGVRITGTDIDETGSKVAQLLNPEDSIANESFEALVMKTEDDSFDGVVGNVPFGDVRGASAHDDPDYKNEKRIERYFILRALDKLQPGRLACLIVPINIVGAKGKAWEQFRRAVSQKAEFLGAHKLPSKTFSAQGTDTVVDIAVFKKHPREFLDRVEDLPVDTLKETQVYYNEWIIGKYWQGEGKRFVMGKYVPKVEGDRWSRETVDSDIDNEALKRKLAFRFESRIDWAALEVAEPIIRNFVDGDRRYMNGSEYELINGDWVKIEKTVDPGEAIDKAKYGAATMEELKALLAGNQGGLSLTVKQAFAVYKTWPDLLNALQKAAVEFAMSQPDDSFHEQAYRGTIIGGLLGRYHSKVTSGTNEDAVLAALQEMVTSEIEKYGLPKNNKGLVITGETSRQFGMFLNSVDEKGNFSDLLAGTIEDTKDRLQFNSDDIHSIVAHLFIREGINTITIEDLLKLYTGSRKIKDLGDIADIDGVALTPDGLIMPMSRYCAGDIYPKIQDMTDAMVDETDQRIIDKYQKQIEGILRKRKTTDPADITFSLQQKWIPKKYIVKFLKENGYPGVQYGELVEEYVEDWDGNPVKKTSFKSNWDTPFGKFNGVEAPGFRKQLEKYLNGGKVTSSKQEYIEEYKEQVKVLNENFNAWLQQHADIDQIGETYNRKFNGYTPFEYDGDIKLEGVGPRVKLHGYQGVAVQKFSEEGRGILADDVGLGKTYEAIALYAYNKQMGRSKKTCIVVPKSVLENWYHESRDMLDSMNSVMMVGFRPKTDKKGEIVRKQMLNEHGEPKRNKHTGEIVYQDQLVGESAETIWEKMWQIPTSNHSLVIMSKEKFGAIPMKPQTKRGYADKMVERSLISEKFANKTVGDDGGEGSAGRTAEPVKVSYQDDKDKARLEQKYSDDGTKKKGEYPYYEDMGFDTVIVDEGHEYKNSYQGGEQSQGIAYLPTAPSAKRAIDMAMKMNYLRDMNGGRGSYLLTATPVTNSPFEIFNMLSLVCPIEAFEEYDIYTVDDFIRVFGKIESVDKVMVSGEVKSRDGLTGFQNLDGLRNLFHKYVLMRNAADFPDELDLPPHEDLHEELDLTDEQMAIYEGLREEAEDAAKPGSKVSMFSVIRDMDRVTTDLDLYNKTMTFHFGARDKQAVDDLMAGMPKSIKAKVPDEDDSSKMVTMEIPFVFETSIKGDVYEVVVPQWFEEHVITRLPNHGIDEKTVGHPVMPKYAKLIANIQKELEGGKQLVFTEEKSQHNKIMRIIVHQVPMLAKALGIINADTATGTNLQKLSNAYNSGQKKVMIANKKAEMGINLQKGTTAIHHLTLPWTPASIQQRNGRGIRQGNTAKHINVFYYLGKGSFDGYRLDLLNKKSNWMHELFFGDKTEADNANAMNADEFMDMLATDPEAAKARRLERLAKKAEERKAREEKRLANTLMAMASAADRLKNLDDTKETERGKLEERIAEEERKLTNNRERLKGINKDLDDMPGQVAEKILEKDRDKLEAVISGRKKNLDKIRPRLKGLDKKYETIKEDLNAKIKRDQSILKGKAAKGELPFNESVIDNPGNVVVTLTGNIIAVGDAYEVIDDFGHGYGTTNGEKGSIFKISEVLPAKRRFLFDMIKGYVNFKDGSGIDGIRWYHARELDPKNFKKVTISEKELTVLKLLDREFSYRDLMSGKLDRDTFTNYLDKINFGTRSYYVVRKGNGIDIIQLWDDETQVENIIYPDKTNANFKKQVAEFALGLLRASKETWSVRHIFEGIFGGNWQEDIAEYGKNATESEIRTFIAEKWKAIAAGADESDPREMLNALNSTTIMDRVWDDARALGDNLADIKRIVTEYLDAERDKYFAKVDELKREEELKELEAIKNHPDFKEVPGPVKEAFSKLGITVKTNMTNMVIPGFRGRRGTAVEPFKKWYIQDENGKSGVLFRTKDILKARYGAKFFSDADDNFRGAWWHIPVTTDLQEVYELLA
jgi:archaellum component FlaC